MSAKFTAPSLLMSAVCANGLTVSLVEPDTLPNVPVIVQLPGFWVV